MTTFIRDHDDEHGPVRHEINLQTCSYCGRSFYPGELSTLVESNGRKSQRCYICKAAADKRYAQATWDELRASGLSESELRERSGAQ